MSGHLSPIEVQHVFLEGHGCHAYQGFLFSPPLPVAEFERFMRASPQLAAEVL